MEITIAINAAGQQVNVHEIEVFTQKGVYTRRIMDAMGHAELQQEIARLADSAAIPDRRRAVDLTHRRDWLRERVRDYVEHQFLLHADVTGRRLREDLLRDVRLSALEQRHHRLLQDLVLRMARRLVSELLAPQESIPARPAARAAHVAPEHEIRRRDLRPAMEVGEGGPAEGLRHLRRQRLGRRRTRASC